MEKKFNLKYVSSKTNEKVKFHKEERGIHSVQPSAETAEDLNQDDILRFSANVSNNPHDFFESKLLLEGNIEKQAAAGGNWEALANADNITLELSAFYKMFKEMTLRMSNDSEIEKVTHPGEVATINQFIMNEYNYPNTDGQLNLFIPDDGDGGHGNGNPEFAKRKALIGNRFQVMLPLDCVFGFFTYVRVALSNIFLTLELQRNFLSENARRSLFFGNPAADHNYRIRLTKARWLIPYTKLNTNSKLTYDSQLKSSYSFSFLANQCSFHKVGEGSDDFRIGLGNIGANIHEMYAVFKEETKAYGTNNSRYIQNYTTGAGAAAVTHKITGISWEIDDKSYPPTSFKFEFDNTENKTIIPFNNYMEICMKRYGVSSPILGKTIFDNLYNIYGIDLSSQDPAYLNKNTSISLQLTKTQNFTPLVYVLTKVEKHIIIDSSKSNGEGSKATTLSLVAKQI